MTGYLGLGSNVGDRRAHLQAAVDALGAHGVTVTASSATYDTDPVGEVLDQPVVPQRVRADRHRPGTRGAARRVQGGRGASWARDLEGGVRHGPRPIDVDVLLLGDAAFSSTRLTLPHAQVTSRRFVLIPLLELDFELRTPDGTRLRDALVRMPLDEGVRREGAPLRVPA